MPTDIRPNEITKAIDGVNFPARKNQLVDKARTNNAPNNVVEVLQKLPDREFNSPAQVEQAYGEMNR